ncbi:hypothetical protein [Cytobacillus firmus]|uniref:hypothetical protein n=1 Tax=Cytobacillus firmus TaxID=1399 RepID=UPI001CFE0581|nr:hypothetical protein [Cytobacillus firmus]
MDKILFGKLIGETYRIQNREGYCSVSEATIYGLLNGFEYVIDEEIKKIGYISTEEMQIVGDVLNEYFIDEDKLNSLSGYYEIEPKLDKHGISRWKAISIITYYKANNQFTNVIEKFNTSGSPVECKNFEIPDYEL